MKRKLSSTIQNRGWHYVWMVTSPSKNEVYRRGSVMKVKDARHKISEARKQVMEEKGWVEA